MVAAKTLVAAFATLAATASATDVRRLVELPAGASLSEFCAGWESACHSWVYGLVSHDAVSGGVCEAGGNLDGNDSEATVSCYYTLDDHTTDATETVIGVVGVDTA